MRKSIKTMKRWTNTPPIIKMTYIRKNIYFLFSLSALLFSFIPGIAQNRDLSGDMLDGILAGMNGGRSGSEIEFDAMLAAMERPSSRTVDAVVLASVADAMTMNGALDFLDGVFSSDFNQADRSDEATPYNYLYSPLIAGEAVLPVSGIITSRFGYRPQFGRLHKGVDIRLQVGDTVCAALDGIVERVSCDPKGYGHFVVIKHKDGLETRYAHLSRALVFPGMRVMAGEPVALGGNTGNSTGPHLHFETRHNGTAFDPTSMFDFTMPAGMTRHRTLADLDKMNPRVATRKDNYSGNVVNAGMINAMQARTGEKSTYVVRPGDTIGSIAKNNGISVLTLCRLNMLSATDPLQPGRMLKLK